MSKFSAPRTQSLVCCVLSLIWWLSLTLLVQGQTTSSYDGKTPSGLAPGAPAGSYPLSGFDNINLYNGKLNFQLPLWQLGGRGAAGYTSLITIEKPWDVKSQVTSQNCFPTTPPIGCTTIRGYWVSDTEWKGVAVGQSAGTLIGRQTGQQTYTACASLPGAWDKTITRLTFTAPDGTEYELRDKLNNGSALNAAAYACTYGAGPNRGRVWTTVNGTAATFISDTDISDINVGASGSSNQTLYIYPSGYMLLRDGTRFRIENGRVSWVRDRNGNKVTATQDALNRTYTQNDITTNPLIETTQYTLRGAGGAARNILVVKDWTINSLRADYRPGGAHYVAGGDLPGGTGAKTWAWLFPDVYAYNSQTSGNYGGNSSGPYLQGPTSITLPDNRQYRFYYNPYMELARVELPTGGAIEYDWDGFGSVQANGFKNSVVGSGSGPAGIYRRVVERRVYADGTTLTEKTRYQETQVNGNAVVTVDQLTPSDTLLARTKHYFYSYALLSFGSQNPYSAISHEDPFNGREYQTETYQSDGVTLLRKTEDTWQARTSYPNQYGSPGSLAVDLRITATKNTLADTNQIGQKTITYSADEYNNQTDVYEYDFGNGAVGSLIRRTHTDYLASGYDTIVGGLSAPDPNATIHLRSLPTQSIVYDAANNQKARTAYEYDNYSVTTNHAVILNRANISGLASRTGATVAQGYNAPADTMRGNATAVTSYANAAAGTGAVTTYAQYDIAGNVVKTVDANGNATTIEFDDRFGYPNGEAQSNSTPPAPGSTWLNGQSTFAFPTKVTNALGHIAYTQVDYFLGKPVDTEDLNNIKSSLYYDDVLDRPTKGIRAVGTSLQNQTLITYDDINKTITTATDKDTHTDGMLQSKALYDGLGRTYRTAASEGSTWVIKETQFDALSRAYRSSNPFRGSTPTAALPGNPEWTTSTFDALSRVTQVMTPDGAHVDTSYAGNAVTVTDQAGKQRRSLTDGLGRLQRVDEPSGCNTCLGSVTAPAQPTNYSYDTLDDLTTVTQTDTSTNVTQTRTFVYDSLKRLTSATNPESGTTTYNYDNNGNLTYKVDALGRSLTYYYDALNRSQGFISNQANTLQVAHYYDGATNGKGKLHYSMTFDYYFGGSTQNAKSLNVINGYDVLGRPQGQVQYYRNAANTDWVAYASARTYDLAGNVKSQTYPSGRVVNYDYNNASQMTTFKGNLGDGTNRMYASEMTYNPAGQMLKEAWGKAAGGYSGMTTTLYQNKHYNNRLQLYDIRLGTNGADEWTWNRGALRMFYDSNFAYGNGGTNNNGNVYRMDHFVPGDDAASSYSMSLDYYGYDALNRITGVWENKQSNTQGETSTGLTQQYIYDRFGNRTVNNAVSNFPGIFNSGFKIDQTTNRLKAITDSNTDATNDLLRYDAVGNQWKDSYTGAGNRTYDANNKLVTATATGGGAVSYMYGTNEKRISKTMGSATTWYIYGLGGELVAEYPAFGAASTPQIEYGYRGEELLIEGGCDVVQWRLTDHLGSTRMSVGASGALASVKRTDYLPFGELLGAGHGPRTGPQGYAADCWRQEFTGKERDSETGLDYFGARYFSNPQGRFISVDQGQPRSINPQSWNRYRYVGNNPLAITDPDGNDDKPAQADYINRAISIDKTLEDVIKSSNNFNQTVFENAFNSNGLTDLTKGRGAILRGLAGEAEVIDSLNAAGFPTVGQLGFANYKPDLLIAAPRVEGSIKIGPLNISGGISGFRLTVVNSSGTGEETLSFQNTNFALGEVKTGLTAQTIRDGVNKANTYAEALRVGRMRGVAILFADAGVWNGLSEKTRSNLAEKARQGGSYIILQNNLVERAEARARAVVNNAHTLRDNPNLGR